MIIAYYRFTVGSCVLTHREKTTPIQIILPKSTLFGQKSLILLVTHRLPAVMKNIKTCIYGRRPESTSKYSYEHKLIEISLLVYGYE